MKVHVFSDCTFCVGVSSPDSSKNWATKLGNVWNDHGFVENCKWQPENCNSFGTEFQVLPTLDIKKHIQKCLNGRNPESFDEWIKFMSMFNNIVMDKERRYRNLFAKAKTLVLPRARVRKHVVGTAIATNLKEHEILSHCRWLTFLKCQTSHPIFSSYRAIIARSVEEREKQVPFSRYSTTRKDSHQNHIYKQLYYVFQKRTNLPVV